MGWLGYLEELDYKDLLDSMADPDKKRKSLVTMVWKAMGEMIEHCQWTTAKKVKYFIHMEAIKTKTIQIKYQLLQIYMDHNNIIKHAQLWKQIVTFFVHTQRHNWDSEGPKY